MTTLAGDICAQCTHFKMKEYPDHAKVGLGRCMGYDGTFTPLANPFRAWSTKACSRFRQDWTNRAARQEWIDKQTAKAEQPMQG
ncbi:hypothetical protein [Massilia haematophila]|uniref:Uncharacterized protein n=1 Tax=Massilia haematophila TaxID=457923 RepID=A0ABV7PH15_9BURK